MSNDKGHPEGWPLSKIVRRRPTLPRSHPRSTIGAKRLSFRVRNGTGRFPLAMAAETLLRYQSLPCSDPIQGQGIRMSSRPNLGNHTVDAYFFSIRDKPSAY